MDNGWTESAEAWIADMGEHGDFTRRCVLDAAMTGRVAGRGFAMALDVGCGERGSWTRPAIITRAGPSNCPSSPTPSTWWSAT